MVTGAAGMLGQDLIAAAGASGHEVAAFSHVELDITDASAVELAVHRAQPHTVVNCAAWTDVDGAESAAAVALSVNRDGAGNVARAAAAHGAWAIHISTDYVFDGQKRAPYLESDIAAPLSSYGRSKLAGERAVAEAAPDAHSIVRSSWLFGAGGRCFPKTILKLAAERDELTVVDDQIGCPTFTGHLAGGLLSLAEREPLGIVHLAGTGQCSWFELAVEICSTASLRCEIVPGRTVDLGRPAPRPAYSVLATERGEEVPRLPDWRQGLADFLQAGVPS